ncbi:MAG TPA: hypothetical protein VMC79_07420 [Rectinemataceae bacterium]|nr:hypothetical protein [Rectinemataceae bacterium]
MRTRQLNAIRTLEAEGYVVKVVDQNFSEELIVYAYAAERGAFKEYIVSSAGKLVHVKDYGFSEQLLEYFQSVDPIPVTVRARPAAFAGANPSLAR